MKKQIFVKEKYLNIPIVPDVEDELITIYKVINEEEREKVMEFFIPIDFSQEEEYQEKYIAQIPMNDYQGMTLEITGDYTEAFAAALVTDEENKCLAYRERRPNIHFTADSGWTNDPNGMVYADGVYHLYYQFNPFDVKWNNMSWGHAVSKDLIHWDRKDPVMFPDADGTIFSGCGLRNDRGLLGLPKEALLFFYTAAGGSSEWSNGLKFTQKIAYSLDGGETLTKIDEPCVPVLYTDSRDPKIFWHEETQAYIMVLWTKGNDFAILRSVDLKNWEMTDEFTLENGWECPDLFHLRSEDGEMCWFFWSADGFYYIGEFDGYHFKTDGKKHTAYLSGIPYAAQTYSGVEDRVITIPWLRIQNDKRYFTGSYGIPAELSCKRTKEGWTLMQKPVRELMDFMKPVSQEYVKDTHGIVKIRNFDPDKAMAIRVRMANGSSEFLRWRINGTTVQYTPSEGTLMIDRMCYQVKPNQKDVTFIIDDRILEVYFKEEGQIGVFELSNMKISVNMNVNQVRGYEIYEIQ